MLFETVINALGWTLLHSVWQGAVIGLLFALSCLVLRTANPTVRHGNALAWLVLFTGLPALTFAGLLTSVSSSEFISESVAFVAVSPGWSDSSSSIMPYALKVLGLIWFSGVLTLLFRLWRDWRQLRLITSTEVRPLPQFDSQLAALSDAMHVRMRVKLVEASYATVPMVVGFFKPFVVIPSSVLLGLTPRELELIVAHELAHLRRNDHLINYFLIATETLFFYHPVVYVLTRTIRHERELCCDDLVISTFNERVCYAHALSRLETLRGATEPLNTLRLAAADGPLVVRIARLVQQRTHKRWGLMPATLLPFLAIGFAALVFHQAHVGSAEQAEAAQSVEHGSLNSASSTLRLTANDGGLGQLGRVQIKAYERKDVSAITVSRITSALTQGPDSQPLSAIEKGLKQVVETGKNLAGVAGVGSRLTSSSKASESARDSELKHASAFTTSSLAVAQTNRAIRSGKAESAQVNFTSKSVRKSNDPPGKLDLEVATSYARDTAEEFKDSSRIAYDMSELTTLYPPVARQAGLPSHLVNPGTDAQAVFVANEALPVTVTGGSLIHSVTPRYPTRARSRGLVDKVVVSIEVDASGKVNQVLIVNENARPMFRRAVVRAVSQWKFEPLLRNGMPVEQTLEQSFDFRLQPYTANRASSSCRGSSGSCAQTT